MFAFGAVIGLIGGWWYLPQPEWAIALKETVYAWFRK
jgi:hypothetical protein